MREIVNFGDRQCGRSSIREIVNWKPVVEARNAHVIFFLIEWEIVYPATPEGCTASKKKRKT